MSCPQCFTGHVNPGKPTGRIETVYGLRTYIAEPADGKDGAKGIIVIVPDAFGQPFVNNQILADHYASMGQYLVYLPDFMNRAATVATMRNMAHLWDEKTSWLATPYYLLLTVMDFVPFMIRNRFGVSWPKVTSFLTALRQDKGATLPVGVAGFCWGGQHAFTLTHDRPDTKTAEGRPLVDAVFSAHASNVVVPGDVEKISLPLSYAVGDEDAVMSFAQVKQLQEVLEKKKDVETEVVVYPGAKHGFSIRASKYVPDSKETKQSEEAEKQAIAWFKKQFAAVEKA